MKTLYKELASGKIAAVFENCESNSERYNNPQLYAKETSETGGIDESLKPPVQPHETLEEKIRRIAREEIAAGV